MASLRVSTTKSEWLPDDPTASVPTRRWKLPSFTTWDDSRNQHYPSDSAEEAHVEWGHALRPLQSIHYHSEWLKRCATHHFWHGHPDPAVAFNQHTKSY